MISTFVAVIVIASVFSVSGSAGQLLPGTSVAFEHCAAGGSRASGRCRPAVDVIAGADEVGAFADTSSAGTVGGSTEGTNQDQNLATPEFWDAIVPGIINQGIKAALDYLFGGETRPAVDLVARPTLFDPT
jgi:hypothetical protein